MILYCRMILIPMVILNGISSELATQDKTWKLNLTSSTWLKQILFITKVWKFWPFQAILENTKVLVGIVLVAISLISRTVTKEKTCALPDSTILSLLPMNSLVKTKINFISLNAFHIHTLTCKMIYRELKKTHILRISSIGIRFAERLLAISVNILQSQVKKRTS